MAKQMLPDYPEATGGTNGGTRWNFHAIRDALTKQTWAPSLDVLDGGDRDEEARVVYLGSWQNNSPSGKTYAPWSSNVTEAEAEADEIWRDDYTQAGLQALGMFLHEHEGDLFAAEIRMADEDEE